MTLSDEQHILNLLHRYAELVDAGRFDDVGALFEHSDYGMGPGQSTRGSGVADIMRHTVKTYEGGRPGTKHIITNEQLERTGDDTMAGKSVYHVLQAVEGLPLQTIIVGSYHDTFARNDDGDGWHFTSRVITVDLVGDLSHHLRMTLAQTPPA